ncbi:N-acetylmuramic acid 6-phosphate etherase [Halalkalibacillus halophilus]|uniref:N-acetylmuramic acid 6-phosphate etherase n=1 Tax=Halalkalibacillus halophilus TaxID=392827 RepID=UPI00040C3858|nr:N-acetylmuramic acid 6-phosphate etherase [Halalkalibacillus halophilus]
MTEQTIAQLTTESRNQRTIGIDQMTIKQIVKIMNEEDQLVATEVNRESAAIESTIEKVYQAIKGGGRLLYIGAGTSGRLGILDASECPPTFRTDPETVQGIMAGGESAMFQAVEGAEDSESAGRSDLDNVSITHKDIVVGIAASGRTPYVIGALKHANKIGAETVALTCNKGSELSKHSSLAIEIEVGPEILTGSTRLKSATAHKMVLNMISTITMVKLGKVYENYMVDVHASNAKLNERAMNIVSSITGVSLDHASETLKEAEYDVKVSIVMILAGVNFNNAKGLLLEHNGFVRDAIRASMI